MTHFNLLLPAGDFQSLARLFLKENIIYIRFVKC